MFQSELKVKTDFQQMKSRRGNHTWRYFSRNCFRVAMVVESNLLKGKLSHLLGPLTPFIAVRSLESSSKAACKVRNSRNLGEGEGVMICVLTYVNIEIQSSMWLASSQKSGRIKVAC